MEMALLDASNPGGKLETGNAHPNVQLASRPEQMETV